MIYKTNLEKLFIKFWTFFFIISSFLFYKYIGFNAQTVKIVYYSVLLITLVYIIFGSTRLKIKYRYSDIIKYILSSFLFSIVMSYIFWEQDIELSIRGIAPYLALLFYFFLKRADVDIAFLEKAIWFFCILYFIVWLYGIYNAPNIVFGSNDELEDTRGIFRLRIPGKGFLVLGFFLALNKFTFTKKKIWIFILTLLFILIVFQVIRQIIFISLIVGLFYYLRKSQYRYIWMFLTAFIVININIEINKKSIIGNLISLSEEQIDENKQDENIRIKEYKYYFTEYSKNIITNIFGNGFAHPESSFGKREANLQNNNGFYASDVGYAEIYIRFGILCLFLYFTLFYKVILQKVSDEYFYAKLFIIYLIFANIAASWIFHDSILIAICLYILEKNRIINLKNQEKNVLFNSNTSL